MHTFYQCQRTNQRDERGAIVLKTRKKVDWGFAITGLCDRVSSKVNSTFKAIESKLDEAWRWVEEQEKALYGWIDEAVVHLANARLQYEFED